MYSITQKYLIKSPTHLHKREKKILKNYKGQSIYEGDINGGKMKHTLLALKNTI